MARLRDPQPPAQRRQEAQPPAFNSVRGITERDFNGWRHHPVTLMFRRYLVDRRDAATQDILNAVLGGGITIEDQAALKSGVGIYDTLADVRFEDIASFYAGMNPEPERTMPGELARLPEVNEEDEDADTEADVE